MASKDFQFSFTTANSPSEVFAYLLNPKNWWVGLFGETIEGRSIEINDDFSFRAGDGLHYCNQQLIEAEAGKKIVWLITESNLSFLKNTNEWAETKICFDIEPEGNKTRITFSHKGLVPEIECYESCSSAWTQYLQKLQLHLSENKPLG